MTIKNSGNTILVDINKITEVKDGVVASVPPKGGMGSLITITSAIIVYKKQPLLSNQTFGQITTQVLLPLILLYLICSIMSINILQIKLINHATPTNKSDIRYSKNTSIDDFDVKRYNEVRISDKSEYAAVMSAIKMRDLNDTPHFEIRKIFAYDNIYLYYYDVDDNPHIVNAKAEESYRSNYYEIDTSTDGLFDDVKTRRSNSRYSEHGDEFLDGRRTTKPNDGLANRKIQTEN